jgi:hypothetical protein
MRTGGHGAVVAPGRPPSRGPWVEAGQASLRGLGPAAEVLLPTREGRRKGDPPVNVTGTDEDRRARSRCSSRGVLLLVTLGLKRLTVGAVAVGMKKRATGVENVRAWVRMKKWAWAHGRG